MKKFTIFLIDIYRYIFSFDTGLLRVLTPGGACKHEVKCSLYTRQMVLKYGVIGGLKLGFVRILKCR